MKKILLFAFAAILMTATSCVQVDYTPGTVNVTQTFSDDFNDNRNNWNFADNVNDAYAVVSNGTLTFNYLGNGVAQYLAKDINYNTYNRFDIETKIGSDNVMGLLVGYDSYSGSYGYTFTVEPSGHFALYDEGGNGYGPDISEVVPRTFSNAVNRNGNWNVLRMEQTGNRWIGYVNGVQVFNIQAQNLRYGSVGFMVTSGTRGQADYIDMQYSL